MTCDQIVSTRVRWPNGEKLACTFELDASPRKSSQVDVTVHATELVSKRNAN